MKQFFFITIMVLANNFTQNSKQIWTWKDCESNCFQSNSVILLLGMLAYNLLRLCGQESLREDNGNTEKIPSYRKKKVKRRRLRTVMLDLIYMAGRIIYTGRQWYISFGKINPWRFLWNNIYQEFICNSG